MRAGLRQGRRPPPKRCGEVTEIGFAHRALRLGFAVCKPYGDSERYDTIVDPREPNETPLLLRVQIKGCSALRNDLYQVNTHRIVRGRRVLYRKAEIDFIAAYVVPEDTWYIIPIEVVRGTTIQLRPKGWSKHDPYAQYREAWHMLRGEGSAGARPKSASANRDIVSTRSPTSPSAGRPVAAVREFPLRPQKF